VAGEIETLEADLDDALARSRRQKAAIAELEAEMAEARDARAQVSGREAELVAERRELRAQLQSLPDLRRALVRQRRQAMSRGAVVEALRGDLEGVRQDLALAKQSNRTLSSLVATARSELVSTEARVEGLEADRRVLAEKVRQGQEALTQSQASLQRLQNDRNGLQASLVQRRAAGAALDQQRDRLARRVDELETLIGDMRDRQREIVGRLEVRTLDTVTALEQVIATAGLDVEDLLAEVGSGETGQGGPFIPAEEMLSSDVAYELQVSVALLDNRLDRWDALQRLTDALPLRQPLKDYQVTSHFGYRRDPVNGRRSFHNGIDLASKYKTPLTAGGAGVVMFAGWRGGYGRVVEIDHGFGITSRYAHLSKLKVEVGDTVRAGQIIGLMGSSGRATGTHVHYEILHRDVNYDPMNFFRAGRHVQ